jgi:hypothetical protein
MADRDSLRKRLLAMQDTTKAIAKEPADRHNITAGKVSPSFLTQINKVLQEVNRLTPDANLALLDDSSEPALSTYPRTLEVLQQIGLALSFIAPAVSGEKSDDDVRQALTLPRDVAVPGTTVGSSSRQYRIFVSHGSIDLWLAGQIAKELQSVGAIPFLDETNIPKGSPNFKKIIRDEISASRELVALFTPWSAMRSWVWIELGAAWGRQMPILAVFYGMTIGDLDKTGQHHQPEQLRHLPRPACGASQGDSSMKRRVFVSYARGDEDVARELVTTIMSASDLAGWMDHSDIAAGEAIVAKIKESLEQASVVVVLVSEKSLTSPWVKFEIGAAVGIGKPIIPILVGRPGATPVLPDWLQGLVYIDARGKPMPDVTEEITRVLSSQGVV